MSKRVYLDYNASAPVRTEVRETVAQMLEKQGNPSSVHAEGRALRSRVEAAREHVAALVGAEPRDVIFTSGGTEANITALSPANVNQTAPERVVLFMSGIEHPSVAAGGRFASGRIRKVRATQDGVIDVAALEREIASLRETDSTAPFMVSLMLANNETGAIQPVAHVSEIVRSHGGVLHSDAVQAAGKVPVDMGALGVHMLTLSAHKIGGPQGVGALVLGDGMPSLPEPLMTGGGQELRARSGTENVAGICGFGVAAEIAARNTGRMAELARLRDRLEQGIRDRAPEAMIFAANTDRLPNTTNFAVSGMKSETVIISLDLAGIAVSAGSSCSSGKVEQSHVLQAMGVADDVARGAIRVSLGWDTTRNDIDAFLSAWSNVYEQFSQERAAA